MIHFKDGIIDSDGNEVLHACWARQYRMEKDIFDACIETGVKYAFAEQEKWQKDPLMFKRELRLYCMNGMSNER